MDLKWKDQQKILPTFLWLKCVSVKMVPMLQFWFQGR